MGVILGRPLNQLLRKRTKSTPLWLPGRGAGPWCVTHGTPGWTALRSEGEFRRPPMARAPPCVGSMTAPFTPPACDGTNGDGSIVRARFRTRHERLPMRHGDDLGGIINLARPDHESGYHGRYDGRRAPRRVDRAARRRAFGTAATDGNWVVLPSCRIRGYISPLRQPRTRCTVPLPAIDSRSRSRK
jgi:hypothetical protein